ncbi:MAG: FAD-dependent monooxygenase [Pseudomonadota bacterium]|nr:FAD-dependent monooxygenase [Pseudomonadota bacterium]
MVELEQSSDVIIVGGGPVGIGLAIDLALQGVRTTVVERHDSIQRIPKGQNLTPRTGEHFRRWGVTEAIRAASPIPRNYGSGGIASYRTFMSDYHYEWFNRAKIVDYYAATNERLPQYETEAVLRARAAEFDTITLLTGWSFDTLDQDDDGVTVRISQTKGDSQLTLSARYLVGCDGARSPVRAAAGITRTTDPHDRLMALLVFHSRQLHEKLSAYGDKTIFNAINPEMNGYWQFLGRVDLDCNWFFHAPVPAGTTRDNFDFHAFLEKAVGEPIDVEFDYVGFWELRLSLADDYGKGRVFIAGDAAHSHPPYGGYGVNTGFEDVRNLSWKLTACLRGWGGDCLLDSYGAERHPVFASTRDDFIVRSIIEDRAFTEAHDPNRDLADFEKAWARRAAGDDSMVTQYLPHYAGSPIVCGRSDARSGATGTHAFSALAGHHLSPPSLPDDAELWDQLGPGFTLMNLTGDTTMTDAFASAANAHDVPLKTLDLATAGLVDFYQADAILLRPDHFVAWAGSARQTDAESILDRATGRVGDRS